MVNVTKFMIHMHMPMAGLVLERTQKIRTSNTRTLACPNFEHLELMGENSSRTRTSKVELRTSIKMNIS